MVTVLDICLSSVSVYMFIPHFLLYGVILHVIKVNAFIFHIPLLYFCICLYVCLSAASFFYLMDFFYVALLIAVHLILLFCSYHLLITSITM